MPLEETQPFPILPPPGPERQEPEAVVDSREVDLEALRQDQIPTAEIPLARPPASTLPGANPGAGGRALGTNTPSTPLPAARRDDTTLSFGAVLSLPGQNTTRIVPAANSRPGASVPLQTTVGFGGVLPLPSSGPQPLSPALQVGATIGAFTLEETLEQGAAFTVYKARHSDGQGEVRLEVVTEAAAPYAQAFLLDARLRTTLDDPRLVKTHALGASPRPWIACEPRSGRRLSDLFKAGAVSDPGRVGAIVLELAGCLEHAHARRVVHGDLVPSDVLLVSKAVPRLTGFSRFSVIARGGERCAYAGGPSLGPASYAAPERFRGEPRRASLDIYALGAILYQGLVGHPPFQGTPAEVMRGALDQRPRLPPVESDTTLGALLKVAETCLAKDAKNRYESAQELALALREALEHGRSHGGSGMGRLALVVLTLAFLAVLAIVVAMLAASWAA